MIKIVLLLITLSMIFATIVNAYRCNKRITIWLINTINNEAVINYTPINSRLSLYFL